jgi:hypothetical protein
MAGVNMAEAVERRQSIALREQLIAEANEIDSQPLPVFITYGHFRMARNRVHRVGFNW